MATIHEFVIGNIEEIVMKTLDTWITTMDEDILQLEYKKLVPKTTKMMNGDIVTKLLDAICMPDDADAMSAVLAPSETPGTTGQGVVLTGDVAGG